MGIFSKIISFITCGSGSMPAESNTSSTPPADSKLSGSSDKPSPLSENLWKETILPRDYEAFKQFELSLEDIEKVGRERIRSWNEDRMSAPWLDDLIQKRKENTDNSRVR